MTTMNDEALLTTLEETARKLSIQLDYDDLKKGAVDSQGGLFILKGKKRILIHKGLSARERVRVLTELLAPQDIETVHIPVEVREILERERKKGG
ncbi:MAG: hypothetical protein ACE5GF_01200 [Thermodesulfobacteriota bacterium]